MIAVAELAIHFPLVMSDPHPRPFRNIFSSTKTVNNRHYFDAISLIHSAASHLERFKSTKY
jgi:hypothetical protein